MPQHKLAHRPPDVDATIRRLLPQGANEGQPDWGRHPLWPPDAFAVAAVLLNESGAYARPAVARHWDVATFLNNASYLTEVTEVGRAWASGVFDRRIQATWRDFLRLRADREPKWCVSAVKLLAMADEASKGMGFVVEDKADRGSALFLLNEH